MLKATPGGTAMQGHNPAGAGPRPVDSNASARRPGIIDFNQMKNTFLNNNKDQFY
jgi:hypothetical protein